MAQWYYLEGNEQRGPVTQGDFDELLHRGVVRRETYVWKEDMPAWIPYGEFLRPTPPKMPPPPSEAFVPSPSAHPQAQPQAPQWDAPRPAQQPDAWVQPYSGYGEPQAPAMVYGGFWARVGARMVDNLLLTVLTLVVVMLAGVPVPAPPADMMDPEMMQTWLASLETISNLNFVIALLYTVGFLGRTGATPGRMLLGLRVVRADGSPIGFARAAMRFLADLLNVLTFGLSYLIVAFDPKKRALHDHICGTRVIRKP